jgi:hypothetical protein
MTGRAAREASGRRRPLPLGRLGRCAFPATGTRWSAAGIPNIVPSRKGFFFRREIQDLRIVLSSVEVPADLSARHAALKTVFFGLSDGEILPLYGSDPQAVPPGTRDAVALLSRLSARRGRASLPDLLAELYQRNGVDFVASRLPEGERVGAEPGEGRGRWPARSSGRAGIPQALPRGDPPQDRGGAGGGRGPGLSRRTRTPSVSSHHPCGQGARVPGGDPGGLVPRREEGAARPARGPGPRALGPDLPGFPQLFRLPRGAARRPPRHVRAMGAGEDGGGGAETPVRRRHAGEGPAVPAGGRKKGKGATCRTPPGGDRRGGARREGSCFVTGTAPGCGCGSRPRRATSPTAAGCFRVPVASPLPPAARPAQAPPLPPNAAGPSRRRRCRMGFPLPAPEARSRGAELLRQGPREAVRGEGPTAVFEA